MRKGLGSLTINSKSQSHDFSPEITTSVTIATHDQSWTSAAIVKTKENPREIRERNKPIQDELKTANMNWNSDDQRTKSAMTVVRRFGGENKT